MNYNKAFRNKGKYQNYSGNGNREYLGKKTYKNNGHYYEYNNKYGGNYEPKEEIKYDDEYDYYEQSKGKYGGFSNDDYNIAENYEKLKSENENLKKEIQSLKEKKEKIELENQKLKNIQKENEKKELNYKNAMVKSEKNIQELKKHLKSYENQIKNKENEIDKLKIEKEKKLNELKTVLINKSNYLDEINKQKTIISKLEEQKFELEKSLENEIKKNENHNNLLKEKINKITLFENKFELIKNIISDIGDTIEISNGNNNRSVNLNEEQNKENEESINDYKIKNGNGNGKVGIINLELNCYMSSVIQILKNIKSFSEKILNTNIDDNILSSFKKLINSLYYSKYNSVDISEFKTNFSKVYQNFEGRKSNDSTFFLIYLFSYLQKILPKTKEKVTDISEFSFLNLNGKETSELKKFITKFESKNNSLIHDLFYNFQMSELICSACNHTKINFQGNNVLFLSLYDGKIKHKSLEQCINSYLFTKDKKDDKEFPCSSCGRNNLSHVISIVKLPPVFIINLKRVGEEGMYSHDITIPYTLKTKNLEKLNNFNKEYELVGFIKHYGSADDGHNVAFTKNIFDQKWYEFNDSKVKSISGLPETDKTFLLFYQLIH